MQRLLDDIDAAVDAGAYYLALMGALTIPDICAALGDPSGQTTPAKYKAWVKDNHPHESWSGDDEHGRTQREELWRFRSALVHQARLDPGHQPHVGRMIFFDPQLSRVSMYGGSLLTADADGQIVSRTTPIDVRLFCHDLTRAARVWLGRNRHDPVVKANLEASIRLRPGTELPFAGVQFDAPFIG